jgi:hypothetical protein
MPTCRLPQRERTSRSRQSRNCRCHTDLRRIVVGHLGLSIGRLRQNRCLQCGVLRWRLLIEVFAQCGEEALAFGLRQVRKSCPEPRSYIGIRIIWRKTVEEA